ncbi:MAG: trehalose 6-phosphate synthase, partial [Cryptosporangiaceae bacterium]|nr:trehalose 6-phosphate synthase [Cryptosporangiaceae bacterium]
MSTRSSFVVVANRLPVDQVQLPNGDVSWNRSPGGLVTALEPIMRRHDGAWIGWAGRTGEAAPPFSMDGIHMHPVALSQRDVEEYYEGLSNGALWPLYHDAVAAPQFHRHWWDTYVEVNRRFAAAAADVADDGAVVWIQDYQLHLVPAMLREKRPDLRIGFFLHIPFPPQELFMQLPWRTALVEGLLGADLIGFQLPGGAQNFLRLCRTLRGLRPSGSQVEYDGRIVRVQAFPISIDVESIEDIVRSPATERRVAEIRKELGDPKHIILGVDRLDYTKGIGTRLKAFHELLEDGTLSVPETVMVQVATPSRERVEHYQALRDEIEREVGHINGDFGKVGLPAVHYLHQSYKREELVALAQRLVGAEVVDGGMLTTDGRTVQVGSFPVSIDIDEITATATR